MKLLAKLVALPLVLGMTLVQWVGLFLSGFSAVFFNMLAGIVFTVTSLGFFLYIVSSMECLKLLLVSFAIYIILHIRGQIFTIIAEINYGLREFIRF